MLIWNESILLLKAVALRHSEVRPRTKDGLINPGYQPIHPPGPLGITFTVPFKMNSVPEGICSPGSQGRMRMMEGTPRQRERVSGDANGVGVLFAMSRASGKHTDRQPPSAKPLGLPAFGCGCPAEGKFIGNQAADYVLQDLKTDARPNEHIMTAGSAC